ncbi:MAG: tail fiber protein [Pseudomonadota bacterium]
MGRKFSDNALTTLSGAITAVSTTLTVAAGKGANFPVLTGKGAAGSALDHSIITMEDAAGNREKIKVEERVVDVLGSAGYPLVRGYDATVARAWNPGDSVDLRIEKAGLADHEDKVQAAGQGFMFGNKDSTTVGLTYGYFGGTLAVDGVVTAIADGTVVLTAAQTNYVERTPAGAVSANIVGFSADKIPMAQVVAGATAITGITDKRPSNIQVYGMLTKSVAGGAGTTVLTAEEARAPIIQFNGALTGDRIIELPNLKRQWTIINGTTGNYILTTKVAGQTGVEIYQGRSTGVIGNGTDIVKHGEDTPPGVLFDYAGSAAIAGYALAADGSNVSRTTYSALFKKIGTTWGVGDGSTTFGVPDSRRRIAVGSGGTGTGTLGNAVGNVGGAETVALATAELAAHTHTGPSHTHTGPSHTHTGTTSGQSAGHTHDGTTGNQSANHTHGAQAAEAFVVANLSGGTLNFSTVAGSAFTAIGYTGATSSVSGDHNHAITTGGGSADHSHTITSDASGTGATGASGTGATGSAGSGTAHNNLQPSMVVTKMVRI